MSATSGSHRPTMAIVLETAGRKNRTIVSAGSDFAALLAQGHLQKLSVVLFPRQVTGVRLRRLSCFSTIPMLSRTTWTSAS
jgi:hypothetical protein